MIAAELGKPLNGMTKEAARKWLENLRKPLAKTASERVDKLRKNREVMGLKRKEVYVHDDDWPELLKLAKRLERRRAKLLASGAG